MKARRALALLALASLSGCKEASSADVVTLRFWGMGREGQVVGELARDFERINPGIRVDVQQIPWSAAHEKFLTAHVGEATPDVSQLGNTWIPEFVALGALEPLDARVAASAIVRPEKFFTGIWATNVVGDSLFGVPWYVDTRLLFYRTDLLALAGFETMPTTWETWREALRRIKSRMRPGQHPVLLPTNEWAQPVILAMQAGAPLLRDDGRYGAFNEPRFRRALDFYTSLYREGLAPVSSAAEVANKYQEFARGNLAMVITGPWEISEFPRRLPPAIQGLWATAPLPGPDGPGLSTAGGSSVVVFRGSKHKDEAWKFVEYLASAEVQLRFHELTGNLPAHRDAWRDSSLANNEYMRAFESQLERVRPLPAVPEIEEIVNRVAEAADRVIRGRQTPDESLRALDREVDRMLEKRRWMLERARP